MSYASAVASLYALGHELAPQPGDDADASHTAAAQRRKWDLAHMRTLCEALGDPQAAFPSVLIAGTNGKGSTAATLASILAAAGYRTALYTSPHLERVNERVQLSRGRGVNPGRAALQPLFEPISDDDFARCYFRVDDTAHALVREGKLPHAPSFFEVMTALAFLYFAESGAEIAVLEVGLGGRLDATNVVEPVLSVITDISLDHMEWLGGTIAEIAREKAGILRRKGVLVTLPQHPEANQAIGEAAFALEVSATNAAVYMPASGGRAGASLRNESSGAAAGDGLAPNRYPLTVLGQEIAVDSPLGGQHQQRNIALAIAGAVELRNLEPSEAESEAEADVRRFNITAAAIEAGIRDTAWPARLELLPLQGGKSVLLDVAHNPAGAWALRSALSSLAEDRPRTLLFGCLRDKAVAEIAQILVPLFDRAGDHVVVTPVDSPRSATSAQLLAAVEPFAAAQAVLDVSTGLARAIELTPAAGILVATGSIYLVGHVRSLLTTQRQEARIL